MSWMLGWQLYCHPRGDSATIAPTELTRLAMAAYCKTGEHRKRK